MHQQHYFPQIPSYFPKNCKNAIPNYPNGVAMTSHPCIWQDTDRQNPKRSLWNCWGFAFHLWNLSGSDSFDAMSKRWFSNVLILYFLKSFIDIDFDIGVSISNYMYLIVFIDNLVCMLFVDIFCDFMWKMVIYWNLDDFMTILLISICWWILRFRLCNVDFIWCSFSPPPVLILEIWLVVNPFLGWWEM